MIGVKMFQPPTDEDVGATERCLIAELSDQLLLQILSRVSCGVTLLDAVPRVCKRWRDLARDPRAWSSVSLGVQYRVVDEKVMVPLDTARLLLHAPVLHRLEFQHSYIWNTYSHPLDSSLRRCTGNVHGMYLDSALWKSNSVRLALLELLQRCRNHLKALCSLPLGDDTGSMLALIRELPHLEDLSLFPSNIVYKGELRSGVPALRLLRFDIFGQNPGEMDLLADLLGGASRTLRSVRVWLYRRPLSVTVLERLARCVGLRHLHADWSCVSALRDLRQVRELTLLWLAPEEGVQESTTELPLAGSLPDLRKLELQTVKPADGLVQLVALARAAPNTTHLTVPEPSGPLRDVVACRVEDVLDAMPRLESVALGVCSVECVPKLMALDKLEQLTATVRCPPSRMTHFLGLVGEFQSSKPNLKASITVELSEQDFEF